jgi:hypothetical protein
LVEVRTGDGVHRQRVIKKWLKEEGKLAIAGFSFL